MQQFVKRVVEKLIEISERGLSISSGRDSHYPSKAEMS